MTNSLLLASGGLDSTTLAYDLLKKGEAITPLFINYGQHCATTELETLQSILPPEFLTRLRSVDVSDIYADSESRLIKEANLWKDDVHYKDLYLPYRSLLLLTVGAAFARGHNYNVIYAAFINSNHAQEIDCSTEFFSRLDSVLSDYGGVELRLPYRHLSKYEVALRAIEVSAPIGRTFSCQASSEIACGACPNCVDRLDALQKLQATYTIAENR
jgi:7-cyano-7-deazaguanine synthase